METSTLGQTVVADQGIGILRRGQIVKSFVIWEVTIKNILAEVWLLGFTVDVRGPGRLTWDMYQIVDNKTEVKEEIGTTYHSNTFTGSESRSLKIFKILTLDFSLLAIYMAGNIKTCIGTVSSIGRISRCTKFLWNILYTLQISLTITFDDAFKRTWWMIKVKQGIILFLNNSVKNSVLWLK